MKYQNPDMKWNDKGGTWNCCNVPQILGGQNL